MKNKLLYKSLKEDYKQNYEDENEYDNEYGYQYEYEEEEQEEEQEELKLDPEQNKFTTIKGRKYLDLKYFIDMKDFDLCKNRYRINDSDKLHDELVNHYQIYVENEDCYDEQFLREQIEQEMDKILQKLIKIDELLQYSKQKIKNLSRYIKILIHDFQMLKILKKQW